MIREIILPQHMYYMFNYSLQARCPGSIQRRQTDRDCTPPDVLTIYYRASEAVAQGGNYMRVAKEFSVDHMTLKRFIRKEKLQGPATSARYEYLSRLKRIFNDRQENDLAEHIKAMICYQYYGLRVVTCVDPWHTNSPRKTT